YRGPLPIIPSLIKNTYINFFGKCLATSNSHDSSQGNTLGAFSCLPSTSTRAEHVPLCCASNFNRIAIEHDTMSWDNENILGE
uniref:Uncharacterized protein n=1 Tax=Glossina palpalis gambiensis TaxID=67801 RepID=A0A1B0B1L5_9MUSC